MTYRSQCRRTLKIQLIVSSPTPTVIRRDADQNLEVGAAEGSATVVEADSELFLTWGVDALQ